MTDVILTLFLFILGAGVGSFICQRVFRTGQKAKRSQCDKCGHALVWSDVVPILSYAILAGKCRYCRAKINPTYVLFEILMGCLFAVSYLNLPFNWLELAVWLGAVAVMMSLFLTDLYYQRLPFVQIVILTIICSIFTVLTEMNAEQIIYSFGVMSHLYGLFLPVLFTVAFALSKGKLIGGGDVLLALPVAILLPWQCVLAVLWLASVLALLSYASVIASEAKQSSRYVLLAGLLRLKPRNDKGQNRNDRARKTPFGSFLIIATLVVLFMVEPLVNFF